MVQSAKFALLFETYMFCSSKIQVKYEVYSDQANNFAEITIYSKHPAKRLISYDSMKLKGAGPHSLETVYETLSFHFVEHMAHYETLAGG